MKPILRDMETMMPRYWQGWLPDNPSKLFLPFYLGRSFDVSPSTFSLSGIWRLYLFIVHSTMNPSNALNVLKRVLGPGTFDLKKTSSFKWHVIYYIVKYFITLYNHVLRGYYFYKQE